MTRTRLAYAAIVLLLLLGAVGLLRRSDEPKETPPQGDESVAEPARPLRAVATPRVPKQLSWMYAQAVAPRRIRGRVLRNGAPAPGVEVQLRSEPMMRTRATPPQRMSDAEGRFDFGEWPATQYVVVAGGEADARAIQRLDLSDPRISSEDITLTVEACTREGFGTVSTLYGEELTEATVTHYVQMRPLARIDIAMVPVDANGKFRICLSERRTDLHIEARGFALAKLFEAPDYPMPKDGWSVKLVAAGAIRGRYVDSAGKGIPGGRMALFRRGMQHHLAVLQHTISDADGNFAFTAVGPGNHSVTADHFDYLLPDAQSVSLAPGEERSGITIVGGDCRSLSGVVKTDSGEPVAFETVWHNRTGLDGSIAEPCVPLDEFELTIGNHRVTNAAIPAGSEALSGLDIRVEEPIALTGRVTLNGSPVAEASVVIGGTRKYSRRRESARSDKGGLFRIVPIAPGTYQIHATTQAGKSDPVVITVGTTDAVHDIELHPITALAVTVQTEDDVEVEGLTVRATPVDVDEPEESKESPAGTYTFELAQGRQYKLSVYSSARSKLHAPTSAPWPTLETSGPTQRSVLRLQGTSRSLSGRVVYSDGRPAADATVRAFPAGTRVVADANGKFSIPGLPAAVYEVFATDIQGLRAPQENVDATKAAASDVELIIESGVRIEGVVLEGNASCRVQILGRNAHYATGANFVFEGLSPGRYTVEATCGQRIASHTTDVRPGSTARVELVLELGREVLGSVRRFPTAEPLGDVHCSAGSSRARSKSSGEIAFTRVPTDADTVDCWHVDAGSRTLGQAPLVPGSSNITDLRIWAIAAPMSNDAATSDLGASLALEPQGLVFKEVKAGGRAERAGIRNGDRLRAVEGIAVEGIERVASGFLELVPARQPVELTLEREVAPIVVQLGL